MAKAGQRKCMSCGVFSSLTPAAAIASGTAALPIAGARARPPNNDYFLGPVHGSRVQAWRAAHPRYSLGRVRPSRALQDSLPPQVPGVIEECANRAEPPEAPAVVALQDLLTAESPLLAGLVAHLFQPALQDDMASTTRRLVQLGRDGINGRCGEGDQATTSARAAAPGPRAVQLG